MESPEFYARLKEPSDDENDMLDLAFGLTQTSRLGCQIVAAKELDGLVVRLPAVCSLLVRCALLLSDLLGAAQATRNFAVDGFVPKPVR